MKLGINSLFLLPFEFKEGLEFARELGAEMIELVTLGEPSRKYCDLDTLLADKNEFGRWKGVLEEYGLQISAISAHGSPLSPNRDAEQEWERDRTCKATRCQQDQEMFRRWRWTTKPSTLRSAAASAVRPDRPSAMRSAAAPGPYSAARPERPAVPRSRPMAMITTGIIGTTTITNTAVVATVRPAWPSRAVAESPVRPVGLRCTAGRRPLHQ